MSPMNFRFANIRLALSASFVLLAASASALAQITIYEDDNYQGRSVTTATNIRNLQQRGFNDRVSSAVVSGSYAWEICENSDFGGSCRVLRPGQYANMSAMGMNDRVSSLRALSRDVYTEASRYAPPPVVVGDYRRRRGEALYEAPVTSATAVYEAQGQRCWVDREQVSHDQGDSRVPGTIIGAVIGGILGHQVGGGSGRDLATVGGVVAGAAVGNQVGRRNDAGTSTREVQRCSTDRGASVLSYWDVTYEFRGSFHRVQLAAPPGPSITVNRKGEPRA